MKSAQNRLESDVKIFVSIVILLIIIGLIFIYSSSSVFALEKMGSAQYYLKKQFWGCCIGLITALLMHSLSLPLLKKATPYFFLISLGATSLTLVPRFGQKIHGSARWLITPLLTFQPSELLKIALLLYCAYFISKKEHSHSFFVRYFPILVLLLITSSITLSQPDFGVTVTLAASVFVMLFVSGSYATYLGVTLLALIPGIFFLIIAKSYRLKRILTFLDPWSDAQGAGFQIIQSLIAIGSGGFFGVGIGHSKQKFFYLPMQHTDFIFSIIAEETGFIGSSCIILLCLGFLYYGFRIASQLTDRFSFLAVTGLVTIISLQAFINICVATGLAPTKGIGLPFISYGNTGLVCQCAMIGIISMLARNNPCVHQHLSHS